MRKTKSETGEGTSGGPVKEKWAKTQKHGMIQQAGELHKPSAEAEALSKGKPEVSRLGQWARPSGGA